MSIPREYSEFQLSLNSETPPKNWPDSLKALWFDAKDDWESSHNIAQDMYNTMGSWIHAYLHRKEGDEFNAGYWYRKAGKPFPKLSLAEELKEIVEYVLKN
ncbi:hypothetical protein [Aurantibacter sp.]|uniref:hypothetical protein n=1 Tax=Aurantibacter sp. TaxID=2807103 RepID=UPI003263715A